MKQLISGLEALDAQKLILNNYLLYASSSFVSFPHEGWEEREREKQTEERKRGGVEIKRDS